MLNPGQNVNFTSESDLPPVHAWLFSRELHVFRVSFVTFVAIYAGTVPWAAEFMRFYVVPATWFHGMYAFLRGPGAILGSRKRGFGVSRGLFCHIWQSLQSRFCRYLRRYGPLLPYLQTLAQAADTLRRYGPLLPYLQGSGTGWLSLPAKYIVCLPSSLSLRFHL